jgi:hypothetical protein
LTAPDIFPRRCIFHDARARSTAEGQLVFFAKGKHSMPQDHWLPGFNFNVEEWFEGDRCETLAICRTLALARAAFTVAVEEKPTGRFMIRNRIRVVKRYPEGDW